MQIETLSVAETAKLVRAALKRTYPGNKFSVRSNRYSGGGSIRIEWTNGPAESDVERLTKMFEGSDFDAGQDLKTYKDHEWMGKRVHFCVDHVICDRSYTPEAVQIVIEQAAASGMLRLPVLVESTLTEKGEAHGYPVFAPGDWESRRAVRNTLRETSF
jgi:hypothetical protein